MAKNLRKLGALLLAAALCLGLLGTSALAVNDTEFHIMDFDGIKGYLVREGVSKEDIQIYSIYVHDENGRTACGIYHLTPYFGAGADTGIQGTNGIATHGGSQYWKVLNASEIIDSEKISGITIYYKEHGNKYSCYIPSSELTITPLSGASGLVTEIYLNTKPSTSQTQTVYVYAQAKDGQGTINEHGYFTIGTITLNIPTATWNDVGNGEARYENYKDAIAAALEGIVRYSDNDWLDLETVEWYTLHASDGADNYVENGTMTWHLNGKIKDEIQLYYVTYDANGGSGTVPVDTDGYMAGQAFAAKSGDGLTYEDHTFLGWSVDPDAAQPDNAFAIPAEGKNVTLYAVWRDDGQQTITEPVNFYVSLDGTVYDYLDENGDQVISAHPTAQFSGSVGTSTVTGKDHSYGLVGKMNAVDATDGAIRALAPDTIAAIPADEATFAALQADTKMQDYCTANGIDISSVTDANYDLYWYVLKYDESDGWHVDGVLVKEGEAPGYAVEYTVKHEYYTDNSLSGSTQSTAIGKVGDVITAESIAKVTSYNGNTYTYTSASAASITLAVDAASNTITLRYDRTTGGSVTPPPVGPSTYTLTVHYVDDEGNTLQDSSTTTYTTGVPYTVTVPAIEGYTYSHAEGDALSGYMSQDRVVTLVYTAGDMDIDDGDVPLDPGPGDGDGDGEIDIDDGDVPLDPGPGGDGDGEIDIDDGDMPLDGAPQTGDNAPLLVLSALLAISGGAVLTLSMTGKKKESTEK